MSQSVLGSLLTMTSDLDEETRTSIIENILSMEFMPSYVLNKKRVNFGCFKSISQALEKLRNDINLFTDLFGFEPAEVYIMALNLLPPMLEIPRRGKFFREECLLVLLSRMKQAVSTLTFQVFLFERDPSTLCDIFSHTAEIIERDFKELLEFISVSRFIWTISAGHA